MEIHGPNGWDAKTRQIDSAQPYTCMECVGQFKIDYVNRGKRLRDTVEMDSVEYMHITCALMLLQIHLKKRLNLLPFLNSLHADLYNGMDGRMEVKQKERMED